ncbi:MAG: hypothetical protein ACI9D5_002951 [Candidatus Endobugula sp.]|jgi:hypothetical protein
MIFLNIDDEKIINIVKPLAEHTEESWNQKNYHGFCLYFLEDDPETTFTEEKFNHQIEENYDVFGKHTIADLVVIHRNPDNVMVIWKVNFENRVEPGLLTSRVLEPRPGSMYGFTEYEGEVLIHGCS